MREASDTFRCEKPQMLWRRHQPPFSTGEARVKRSKVPRGNGDHSAWVQMPTAKGQGVLRVGKMLDDVQQYDDIEHAQLRKNSLRGNSVDHGKTAASAKRDGCIRDFNTGHHKSDGLLPERIHRRIRFPEAAHHYENDG